MTTRAHGVAQIVGRSILDSHATPTIEFDVVLSDGTHGRGSAPRGETISVYEDRVESTPARIEEANDALRGRSWDQASFDEALRGRQAVWGRRTCLALSVAFFNATRSGDQSAAPGTTPPLILYNVLNGGMHAYTHPIRADLHELLLLPLTPHLWEATHAYLRVQQAIRDRLERAPLVRVGANQVHDLGEDGDQNALQLTAEVLESVRCSDLFSVMVDASAGDWWTGEGYTLPVSGKTFTTDELAARWQHLVATTPLRYIEDPFSERDDVGWARAHAQRGEARLVGDNFTSSRRDLLEAGRAEVIDGMVVKPDQSGTVSDALDAARAARAADIFVVASHRSIETESVFLIDFALEVGAQFLKVGPLRDFSAVVKVNELLRRVDG